MIRNQFIIQRPLQRRVHSKFHYETGAIGVPVFYVTGNFLLHKKTLRVGLYKEKRNYGEPDYKYADGCSSRNDCIAGNGNTF